MACNESERSRIKRTAELLISKLEINGKPIKNQSFYKSEDILKVLDTFTELESIYPGIILFTGDPSVDKVVRINIEVPDHLVEIPRGTVMDEEKLKFNYRNDFPNLLRDNLKRIFEPRHAKLKEAIKDAYLQMMQVTDIKLRQAYIKIPATVRGELSRIRNDIKDLDYSDLEKGIEIYTAYLTEASVVAEEILEAIKTADGPDRYKVIMDLHSVIVSYKPLLESLKPYTTDTRSPLYEVVNSTLSTISQIETIYVEEALENSLDQYEKLYNPVVESMRKKKDEKIAKLQDRLRRLTDPAKIKATEDRIQELEKQFEYEAPTREVLRETLTGKRGDISLATSYIRAAIANPDFIVSGMMERLKAVMNSVNRKLVGLREEFAEMLPKSGVDPTSLNVQRSFEPFIQTYTYYYAEGNEVKEIKKAALLTEYDISHLTEESRLIAEVEVLRNRLMNGEDVSQEHKLATQALKEFRLRTYTSPYTDEYYAADRILDTVIDGKTVREYRKDIMNQLSQLSADIRFSGYKPTQQQIRQKKEILIQLKNLETFDGKTPGSKEYRIAEVLKRYRDARKDMISWEVTDDARKAFNTAKAQVDKDFADGKITSQERESWYQYNTITEYKPEYFQKIKEIVSRIADQQAILNRFSRIPSGPDIKTLWDEIVKESRPYRDQDGIIDATLMPEALRLRLIAAERTIMEIKDSTETLSGLSKEERVRLSNLINLKNLRIQSRTGSVEDLDREIDALMAKKRKFSTTDQAVIDEALETLGDLYAQLRVIQSVDSTPYFKEEYNSRLEDYKQQNRLLAPTEEFYYGGLIEMKDGQYIKGGQVLTDDEVHMAWELYVRDKFENESPWVQENMIDTYSWDPVIKEFTIQKFPAYVWSSRTPMSERFMNKHQPSFQWRDMVVNPNYINDFTKDIKGKAPVKNPRANAAYASLSADQREYLRFITTKYFESQSLIPQSQRMGIDLPAIERDMTVLDTVLNPKERAKTFTDQTMREMFTNQQDIDEAYGDTTNRMVKYQPMMFSGEIDSSIVNYNLHQSILRYAGQAMKYKEIQDDVIPLTTATEAVLTHFHPSVDTYSRTASRWGVVRRLLKPEGENNRLKVFRDFVDTFIYNQREIDDLPEFEVGGKNLKLSKVFSKLLGVRAASLMAGSVLPQGANLTNGILQGIITSVAKKGKLPFSVTHWLNAHRLAIKHSAEYVADMHKPGNKSKFTLMMDYFQAVPDDVLNTAGYELEQSALKKAMSTDILFFVKNSVEWELSAATFMAMATSYKVNYRGQQVTMWDMFEKRNGRLEPREMTKEENAVFVQEMDRFIKIMNGANRDINGNYANMDKTLAERFWFGRAVFFLKKFVVPFFETRFSKRRYSNEYEDYIEGYHRSAVKMIYQSIREFMKGRTLEDLTFLYNTADESQRGAFKAFITEMMILGILIMLGKLVYDEDDEERFQDLEKESFIYQTFVYTLLKTKSEMKTFIFPFGVDEIDRIKGNAFTEVFPFLSQLVDLVKTIDWDDLEMETYKRDTGWAEKGDLKFVHQLMKLVGGSPAKSVDPIQAIKNLEAINR